MNGKEVPWFRHDFNARNDERMQALNFEYGMEGVGRFWVLVEMLREQSDYRLPLTRWTDSMLSKAWGSPKHPCTPEEAHAFLDALVHTFALIEQSDTHIWSNSLLRRMKSYENVVEKRREHGKKAAQARWADSPSTAQALPEQSPSNAVAQQDHSNGLERSGLERTREEGSGQAPSSAPPQAEPQEGTVIPEMLEIHKKATGGITLAISEDDMPHLLSLLRQYDGPTVVAAYRIHQKEKPGKELRWFLKDFTEFHAKAKKQKERPSKYEPEPLHTQRTPEEELQVELAAAKLRQSKHEPLTERDKEVLGINAQEMGQDSDHLEDMF